MDEHRKKQIVLLIIVAVIIGFFILASYVPESYLKDLGNVLPLPVFTFIIALVDGFNPCNMFILTYLLGLLVTASHSRKRIYTIGYVFVGIIFIIYFLFMAAWLNIFKYMGFYGPLRIIIAIIAILAGLINCKEMFCFRKGITLMIQEKHKAPLMKRLEHMKEVIKKGSYSALVGSSVVLAAFSSLVELPCTAGFPLIYTAVITGKILENSFTYYLYLLFYNAIYILPLAVIIGVFGYSLKTKQISKEQMQWIKLIGGLIMIALGIILLANPELLMGGL